VIRTVLVGAAVAVAAGVVLLLGDALGWGLDAYILVGAGAGAVLGLVVDRGPVGRVLAFLIGMIVTAVGYALRAAVLPDNTFARALAAALVIVLIAVIAGAARKWMPFWAGLLGMVALAGAYEEAFTDSPGSVASTLPPALASVLLMAAVGFAAGVFLARPNDSDEDYQPRRAKQVSPTDDEVVDEEVGLDDVLQRQGGN
jgi:hypothetical protein